MHAYPQTMKAAVEGRAGSELKILAVTVLTSYDDGDLHAAGYRLGVSDLVEARAQQAQALGVDGLVCSPEEAAALRKIVGHQMSLVTPGIRPAGRRHRRPEAHHDAGARHRRRRGLSGGRPPGDGGGRSEGGGGSDRRPRSRRRWASTAETERRTMAKGYWIARIDVHNMDGYKEYVAQNGAVFAKYGARFLVRGGKFEAEGGHGALAQCGARIQGL